MKKIKLDLFYILDDEYNFKYQILCAFDQDYLTRLEKVMVHKWIHFICNGQLWLLFKSEEDKVKAILLK